MGLSVDLMTRLSWADIINVEKRVSVQTDVHECCLHSREDVGHLAEVDVPSKSLGDIAHVMDLNKLAVFKDCSSGFQTLNIEDGLS